MRPDEAFVAHALVQFLGGPSIVSAFDDEDPPDFYLTIADSRIGVEVTHLSPFTFEPGRTFGNRTTQDSFGLRLLDELDVKIGPSLPEDMSLLVILQVPVSNAARFRKKLTDWGTEIAITPKIGAQYERRIEGSKVRISVVPKRSTGKKIVGIVANTNSSTDIVLNARLILEDRIRAKSEICAKLSKPIWLAVLNDYWLADADDYAAAYRQLEFTHCFERIFVVSYDGTVSELEVEA
ncbi:MAG: hypothetical protein AB7G75_07195 [Candidatus Binatia bacterium]